jgi:hypothetical protein
MFLGRVIDRRPGKGSSFARVQPRFEASADRMRWIGPVANPDVRFPRHGLVFWFAPPENAGRDTLWEFEIEERPVGIRPKEERFQIRDARPCLEVLDCRGWSSEEDLRRQITGTGVRLLHPPATAEVVLWLSDNRLLGPVRPETGLVPGHWVVVAENAALVPVWQIEQAHVRSLDVGRTRDLLPPGQSLGQQVGTANWLSDSDFANGVLRRLRKADRVAFDDLRIAYSTYEKAIASLKNSEVLGRDFKQELGRAERLRSLERVLRHNEEFLRDAAEILSGMSEVRTRVDQRVADEYNRILTERKEALDASLAEKYSELADLERKLSAQQAALAETDTSLAQRGRELEESEGHFREMLIERLRAIEVQPEPEFANLALMRAVFANDNRHSESPATVDPTPARQPTLAPAASIPRAEAVQILGSRLRAQEVRPFVAFELLATWLAGMTPVLVGRSALDASRTMADVVCGGHRITVSVGGTLFDASDLLEKEVFGPIAGASVREVLEQTKHAEQPVLILVEGANRAPIEHYAVPLLNEFAQSSAALLSPASGSLTSAPWPGLALPLLVPLPDGTTVPFPRSAWERLTLVRSEDPAAIESVWPAAHPDVLQDVSPTAITKADIGAWREKARSIDLTKLGKEMTEVANRVPSLHASHKSIARLYAGAVALGLLHESAMRLVARIHLAPMYASDQETQSALSRYSTTGDDISEVVRIATQMTQTDQV